MLDPDRYPRLFSFVMGLENSLPWSVWLLALTIFLLRRCNG
jgi:hypothetical protein